MDFIILSNILLAVFMSILMATEAQSKDGPEESLDGYYTFVESPNAVPPRVRPPPYTYVNLECKNTANGNKISVSVNNICGDLNKGQIPKNPMRQNVLGEPYPFELIRNKTLKFFSKTLPVLKADDTLPKVTQIQSSDNPMEISKNIVRYKAKRNSQYMGKSFETSQDGDSNNHVTNEVQNSMEQQRQPRKFCDGGGIFCSIYRALQGDSLATPTTASLTAERREEIPSIRYDGPPTPCPAKVEYATPVFSKNYQGTWRYVVQIPYEGYFTQTVEVTRCIQVRCHYLDGGCLSSPRWVSLLVAEIFYPNSEDILSTTSSAPSVQDFQAYQQYLQKRAGLRNESDNSNHFNNAQSNGALNQHCDGYDDLGCFQVRLYYDWFLIPGSCKCWRPDYFAKYVHRKSVPDL